MENQTKNSKWDGWIITIFLSPLALAIILILYIFFSSSPNWLNLAYWALTAILLLFAVEITLRFYLKRLKIRSKQKLKSEKQEVEKQLAEKHHEYRLKSMKYEIRMKELEIEKMKVEKGKG